jgi:membrane fusion protein (multidrug efflux system)
MMNKHKYLLTVLIISGWHIGLQSCSSNPPAPAAPATKSVDSAVAIIVQQEPVSQKVSFPAELLPLEKAELYAKVNAYVKTIKADIGDRVSAGQVLIQLDAPELLSDYARANAEVQSARSRFRASMDVFQRIEQASRIKGSIATVELERSRNQMQADSAAYEAARSRMNSVSQLKDYLTIRSPFTGVVVQRNADAGSIAGGTGSKPLLVVENNSPLRVRIPVEEAYHQSGSDTASLHFTVDALPGKTFTAKPSRKAGTVNKDNRTETWEYLYENKNHELSSGMYANGSILLQRPVPSLVVPPSCIATTLEKKFVIRIRNGKTEWVDVKPGWHLGEKTEIFGNLQAGDTLLQKANDEIKPGSALLLSMKK